jgi:hypothetical protein
MDCAKISRNGTIITKNMRNEKRNNEESAREHGNQRGRRAVVDELNYLSFCFDVLPFSSDLLIF